MVNNYTNMIFSVTDSNRHAQHLIVNNGVVSPTLNVNPTLFVIPYEILFWGTMA